MRDLIRRWVSLVVIFFTVFAACSSYSQEEAVALIGKRYLEILSTEVRDYGHARDLGARLVDCFHLPSIPNAGQNGFTPAAYIGRRIITIQVSFKTHGLKFRKKDFYIGSIRFTGPENARVVIRNRKSDRWRTVISLRKITDDWKIHDIA
ncbi:MAG: hypothetical protein GF392_01430 [Candidatus Omnitrophica bacterium]|nr:hypothetical protein [Candidatus Omnitrophota bacterium]